MTVNIPFRRKETEHETEHCVIEEVVELAPADFDYFKTHLLEDFDFLTKNREKMGYSQDGTRHCLLVMATDNDDGILVDAQGSNYARYSAYLPKARQAWLLEQYNSLADFVKEMHSHVERAVQTAIANQMDGSYYLQFKDFPDPMTNPLFDHKLLEEMLSERPEFSSVETMSDEILVAISPEYQKEELDLSEYRELCKEDVEIMLAKHMLFLRDAGGEIANFSGCVMRNIDLPHAIFNNAVIEDAAFVDCNLSEADMNFVSAHGAVFKNCDLSHFYGDEGDFTKARFIGCDMHQALTMHANYTGAEFNHCNVERMLLEGCCLAQTEWTETDSNVADTYRAVYSAEEYSSEMKMD